MPTLMRVRTAGLILGLTLSFAVCAFTDSAQAQGIRDKIKAKVEAQVQAKIAQMQPQIQARIQEKVAQSQPQIQAKIQDKIEQKVGEKVTEKVREKLGDRNSPYGQAVTELRTARQAIVNSPHDFGGQRDAALRSIDRAIADLQRLEAYRP